MLCILCFYALFWRVIDADAVTGDIPQEDSLADCARPPATGAKPTASPSRVKRDYIYIEMVRINYDWAHRPTPAPARCKPDYF